MMRDRFCEIVGFFFSLSNARESLKYSWQTRCGSFCSVAEYWLRVHQLLQCVCKANVWTQALELQDCDIFTYSINLNSKYAMAFIILLFHFTLLSQCFVLYCILSVFLFYSKYVLIFIFALILDLSVWLMNLRTYFFILYRQYSCTTLDIHVPDTVMGRDLIKEH